MLAYRYILLYFTIGLEITDARIVSLTGIGGLLPAGPDRFRRMLKKMVRERKGVDPTLEIRRLFAAARNS